MRELFILNLTEPILKRVMNSISVHWMLLIGGVWYSPLPGYFRQAVCFFMLGLYIGSEKSKEACKFHKEKIGTFLVGGHCVGNSIASGQLSLFKNKDFDVHCAIIFCMQIKNARMDIVGDAL